MYAEGALEPEYRNFLNRVIAEGGLISVRSLSSPFSAYTREAVLSYAQSYSLVEFLISNYGQSQMLELLHTFGEGRSYNEAVEKAYGFDMDGLDGLWRDYATRTAEPVEEKGTHPALIGILAALAIGLLLGLGLFMGARIMGFIERNARLIHRAELRNRKRSL